MQSKYCTHAHIHQYTHASNHLCELCVHRMERMVCAHVRLWDAQQNECFVKSFALCAHSIRHQEVITRGWWRKMAVFFFWILRTCNFSIILIFITFLFIGRIKMISRVYLCGFDQKNVYFLINCKFVLILKV